MSIVRKGSCEHCWVTFDYCLYHLQWDRLRCGYCERCGCAVVSGHKLRISDRRDLPRCRCGGRFSSTAVPRCPSCAKELSPGHAATYIGGAIPPGSVSGHDWPRAWPPGPCFVINDRVATEGPGVGDDRELIYR